mgnify:CR=1 FL=1
MMKVNKVTFALFLASVSSTSARGEGLRMMSRILHPPSAFPPFPLTYLKLVTQQCRWDPQGDEKMSKE